MKVKLSNYGNKVDRIVAKGEMTHYEQFLLLPEYFQMPSAAEESICTCMQEGLTLSKQQTHFDASAADDF